MYSLRTKRLLPTMLILFCCACSHQIDELEQVPVESKFIEVSSDQDEKFNDFIQEAEQQLIATSGRVLSTIEGVDLSKALKRTGEDGKVTYSLYINDENPLILQNLILEEDDTGDINGALFEYQVDLDWFITLDEFPGWGAYTGAFRVRDLEGKLIYETPIIDGNSPGAKSQAGGGRTEGGYCVTTTETFCTYIQSTGQILECWQEIETVCYSDGGDDSGDQDPYLTDDGEEELNGAGYPTESGIYDTNEGDNLMTPEEWERQIDDNNLRPCMKNIISDIKQLDKGMAYVIARFSSNLPGYNWKMQDNTLNGQTGITAIGFNTTTGTVTSIFDSQSWPNATDLSWARTILHESIHAYVVAINFNGSTFTERQNLLGPNWMNAFSGDGHDFIANNLVGGIADALQEFGQNRGYNLSRQFYEDLAWGGLQQTTAFNSLSTTDRNRITNTISIEVAGKDRFGSTRTQKGRNAGC